MTNQRVLATLVTLAAHTGILGLAAQDGPKVPEPPAELRVEPTGTMTLYDVNVAAVTVPKDGPRYAEGVRTAIHPTHKGIRFLDYVAHFGRLREGDLFPLLGRVYRVDRMFSEARPGGRQNAVVLISRLDPKDVPAGVTLRPMSVVVPHTPGDSGGTRFAGHLVRFVEYQSRAAGYNPPRARLVVSSRESPHYREARVRAGDVVLIGGLGYEVLSVTPPDEKTKIIGWLELAPKGVPEKDLVEKEVPLVRPGTVPGKAPDPEK